MFLLLFTGAAVEGQLGGGPELLDEELGEGDALIGVQRLVALLPVQHEVIVRVGVWGRGIDTRAGL